MRFSEVFLIALKYFLRRKWCTTSIGYLNIFSLKAVTIFIISRKFYVGFSTFFFRLCRSKQRACHLARRPRGGVGRYLFRAWANHKCTAKIKKIWNKISVLIPNAPICDGFKVREWLYEACWYFSWYWRVFIACKLWELNRGVQKACREQNHLRLHTRLTSEKQLFVCFFL